MNSTLRRIAVAFPRWRSAGVELSGILAGVSGRTSVKLGPGRGALKPALDVGRWRRHSPWQMKQKASNWLGMAMHRKNPGRVFSALRVRGRIEHQGLSDV
jgi:hypothetical protein